MNLEQEWYHYETNSNYETTSHRTQNEELSFYRAVSSGDLDSVRQNCEQQRFTDTEGVGILSRNPVTNLKYHFVITAALVVRFCVSAGMEMEQAYRLSDFYILKLDDLHSVEDISELHDRMVLDFTGKMRLLNNNNETSKLISICLEYIYTHIRERITINDLATHTGFSTSYLSHLFKQEVGISVSDYIREKKIEKAQNLLKYCDYSLTTIADYLSFSSQSHFTQVFLKQVGMTPKKYRNTYYSSDWNIKEQSVACDTVAPERLR